MAPNVTRAYSPECVEGFGLLKNPSVSPSEIPSRAQRPALAAFRNRSATILVHRPVGQRLFQQAGFFCEVGLPLYGFLRSSGTYVARSFSRRTIITGQWAWRTTESETLPIKARLTPPRPLLPITIRPASISS